MTEFTNRFAFVLGPALVAVTVSEAINLDIWSDVHPTLVCLNGLLFLVGGLVVITCHNHWKRRMEQLVTFSGWLLFLAGAWRMFFPKACPTKVDSGFVVRQAKNKKLEPV